MLILLFNFRDEVTPHVALVNSQDAPSIKHLVENTVWQLINGNKALVIFFYFIIKNNEIVKCTRVLFIL